MEPLKENLCLSCVHHRPDNSLDDVAEQCYPCVWQQSQTGQYINYQPNLGALLRQRLDVPPATPEEDEAWEAALRRTKPGEVKDNVNHPGHYTQGGIETIDFIRAKLGVEGTVAYCMGNVIKYVTRWKDKNGLEDLKKALWYLNYSTKLIEENK